MLPSINTFFKIERDPFFKMGKEQGEAEKSFELVSNLIEKFGFNDSQVADVVNVSTDFVKEVRKSLNKPG